jgi:hypothetical protein
MNTPDLSVVMPNYNHARYLGRSIAAILGQTVRPREFIIIDDCSTDDSVRVIEEFARRDSLIRLVRNDRNRGVLETFDQGLRAATGEYFAGIAADDLVLPTFVEKSMDVLRRYPRAGMSCGYLSVVNGETNETSENPSRWCTEPSYFSPERFADFIGPNGIGSNSAVYRRSSFERAGGYPADLKWHCDWFLNLVIAFREGICHVPETLGYVTVLPSSYSAQGHRDPRAQAAVLRAMLDRLLSPEFADVAPHFRNSGVMGAFGPGLVRAAAGHPQRWDARVLGLINGLQDMQYEALLADEDPEVRQLAAFTLGAAWRVRKRLREEAEAGLLRARADAQRAEAERTRMEAERARAEDERARAEALVAFMRSSKFWKVREGLVRCKRALKSVLPRRAAG